MGAALFDELRPRCRAACRAADSEPRRFALLGLPRSRLAAAACAASAADLTSATLMSQQIEGWFIYAQLMSGLAARDRASDELLLAPTGLAWRLHCKLQADLPR
jgi:hypothetical protein